MGNVPLSCCRTKIKGDSSTSNHDQNDVNLTGDSKHDRPQSILQHISEREPDDSETDPSSNPYNAPMFRNCAKPFNQRLYSEYIAPKHTNLKVALRKKFSSCSTIFIDASTISQPCIDLTIKSVSLAIYYHIKNRSSNIGIEIFDESLHPLKMTNIGSQADVNFGDNDDSSSDETSKKSIYVFVYTLFNALQLTSEYAITTLVYLERLMTYAEMDLTPNTWRRMFLGAILLSSKVWEDQAVWNVDYAQILEEISVEDINELERQFLELIQFNMNVPSSIYAKYYFHLRKLAFESNLTEANDLLTIGRAKTLEAMSRTVITDPHSSPVQRKSTSTIKRHASLEKLRFNGQARAVLM